MKINLEQFCDANNDRLYFQQPNNIDDRTVATDGHILISIPKAHGYNEIEGSFAKSLKTMLEDIRKGKYIPFEGFNIPKSKLCELCNQTGKDDGHLCPACLGTGKEYSAKGVFQDEPIGFPLAPKYLNLIKDLPNMEIAPNKKTRMLRFRSGDIEGALMGTTD